MGCSLQSETERIAAHCRRRVPDHPRRSRCSRAVSVQHLCGALDRSRAHRDRAHARSEGRRLQRSGHGGIGAMDKTKETAFGVKISMPQMDDDRPVTIEDFCRYLIQPNAYFFIPCRELWPGSSVNARLPRVPMFTANGQPKHDKNGKPISIPATKWIDDNRRVEQTTWHPGLPMFITNRL